ncbi:hypothetical protein SODG_003158 [Sodalis praecaptivus]|nr:hypothetical protein NVIRENTERO_04043 [Sodalis praecaptivus]
MAIGLITPFQQAFFYLLRWFVNETTKQRKRQA